MPQVSAGYQRAPGSGSEDRHIGVCEPMFWHFVNKDKKGADRKRRKNMVSELSVEQSSSGDLSGF